MLTYHVVSGAVESRTLRSRKVASVEGSSVAIHMNRTQIRVTIATVTSADVKVKNRVIHIIDPVLLPQNL